MPFLNCSRKSNDLTWGLSVFHHASCYYVLKAVSTTDLHARQWDLKQVKVISTKGLFVTLRWRRFHMYCGLPLFMVWKTTIIFFYYLCILTGSQYNSSSVGDVVVDLDDLVTVHFSSLYCGSSVVWKVGWSHTTKRL